jgi:hypothetical protein
MEEYDEWKREKYGENDLLRGSVYMYAFIITNWHTTGH